MTNIVFDWGISDYHGWGVYGFNLLYWTQKNPNAKVIPKVWPPSFLYPVDPLVYRLLRDAEASWRNVVIGPQDVRLSTLANQIKPPPFDKSARDIGVIFFECNPLKEPEIAALKAYETIVTGSSWNRDKLREMGVENHLVIQGIDTDLFGIKQKRLFRDRFVVFSGGKLEFRKGQDLVLKAFSLFCQKHKDAVLISTWRSPWETKISPTVNASNICEPLVPQEDMKKAADQWVFANGVPADQYIGLDAIPNRLMPEIYREVDLAIFPNRCEGGTNLVAMEAMSSGIPCIVSANTGHLDIISEESCWPLWQQAPITELPPYYSGNEGIHSAREWGESSVDEIVANMEKAYDSSAKLDRDKIRASVAGFTWEASINNLLKVVGVSG